MPKKGSSFLDCLAKAPLPGCGAPGRESLIAAALERLTEATQHSYESMRKGIESRCRSPIEDVTEEQYLHVLVSLVEDPSIGSRSWVSLVSAAMQFYQGALLPGRLAFAKEDRYLNLVRSALAVRQATAPQAAITRVMVEQAKTRANPATKLALEFAVQTGIRHSELEHLLIGHVAGIPGTDDIQVEIVGPKGKATPGQRPGVLTVVVRGVKAELIAFVGNRARNRPLFENWSQSGFNSWIKKVARDFAWPDPSSYSFHGMRRGCARDLWDAGTLLEDIGVRIGWANIQTAAYYAAVPVGNGRKTRLTGGKRQRE